MAGLRCALTTEGEIALTAATAKTILQVVAAANHRVSLCGFSVSFDGVTAANEPVNVELLVQSTAGTMSAATPVRDGDPGSETLQTTAQKNATVEPTAGNILRRWLFHPQGGGMERSFGYDERITIPGGTRLGLRCTAPQAVNVVGHMLFEEYSQWAGSKILQTAFPPGLAFLRKAPPRLVPRRYGRMAGS